MNDGLPPRWRAASETLTTLLTWLAETRQWVETTAAAVPQTEPAGTTAAAATSEVSPEEGEGSSPDLYTLLAALTALRQEVKLQTRSARHDREQTAQALEQVSQTVTQLDATRQADRRHYEVALQEAERAMAEALVEVHDAFSRATREAERIVAEVATGLRQWGVRLRPEQENGIETPPERAPAAPGASTLTGPPGVFAWLRARFTRPAPVLAPQSSGAETALPQCWSAAGPMADRLEGLAEGYKLSLERLERLLATYGIEPIVCLGQPVDAELMEVVQIVVDSSRPAGTVLDEVRRGYRRHGRVWRFAQVVATRAALPANATPPAAAVERQEEA